MLRWFSGAVVAAVVAVLLVPAAPSRADLWFSILPLRTSVITAPGTPAASASFPVRVQYDTALPGARWQLVDVDTDAVALDGPAPTTSTTFSIDPTAANGGVPLPDGSYRLTLAWDDVSGSHSATSPYRIELAQEPPPELPRSARAADDVIPAADEDRRRDAALRVPMMPGLGWGAEVPDGVLLVRNATGTTVHTRSIAADCTGDGIYCIEEEHIAGGNADGYEWSWDGKVGGRLQPAGRYELAARLPDRFGRIVEVDLGPFWIRHLETRRASNVWAADLTRASYRTVVGRCSSVTSPGPHGWAGSIGLLSKSRCRSSLGAADKVFQTLSIDPRADLLDRLVRMRVDVYGAPARAGSRGSVVVVVNSTRSGPVWRRTTVLGAGLGWHNGRFRDVAPAIGTRLTHWAQARVTDGNRYDLKYVRLVFDYRTWVR